jgi:hypothetical protein
MPRARRLLAALGLVSLLSLTPLTISATALAQADAPGGTVPIKVLHGRSGSAVILVRIRIGTRYGYFVVDTGAEKSLIDSRAAKYLKLPASGRKQRMCGITGCAGASRPVHVGDWSAGEVRLPATSLARTRFLVLFPGPIIASGLLGSDVLSTYGQLAIDFAHSQMTLGTPGVPATPSPDPTGTAAPPSAGAPGTQSPGAGLVAK